MDLADEEHSDLEAEQSGSLRSLTRSPHQSEGLGRWKAAAGGALALLALTAFAAVHLRQARPAILEQRSRDSVQLADAIDSPCPTSVPGTHRLLEAPLSGMIPLPCIDGKQSDFWYATLMMSGNAYLPAVKVMASSLKASRSRSKLLVMLVALPTPELEALAECLDFYMVIVPVLSNPRLTKASWAGTYTKLSAFRLKAKRIVYLDLDTVVLRNPDELFSVALDFGFNAAPDVGKDWQLNSGVFVVEPTEFLYRDLVSFAMATPIIPEPWYDGGDQGLLSYYFRNKWSKATALPERFDTLKYAEGIQKNIDIDSKVIVHLCGLRKPWDLTEKDRMQVTEQWPQSYAAWWRAEADFKQRYAGKCPRQLVQ
ncbi:gyg-1 [Symbiodinium microadriaticum]|nr:gyg-1 [Symbiodinium microadriaticum]